MAADDRKQDRHCQPEGDIYHREEQEDQDSKYLFHIRHQTGGSHPDCAKCNAHRKDNDRNYDGSRQKLSNDDRITVDRL